MVNRGVFWFGSLNVMNGQYLTVFWSHARVIHFVWWHILIRNIWTCMKVDCERSVVFVWDTDTQILNENWVLSLKYRKWLFSQFARPQLIQWINQALILNKMSIKNMSGCCCIVHMCCMLHVDWNISRIVVILTTNRFDESQKTFIMQNDLYVVCVCYSTCFILLSMGAMSCCVETPAPQLCCFSKILCLHW